MGGLLIASPMSGSGKTTFTLGLLRALRNRGIAVAPGKAGPDYIDPAFHQAASGEFCLNYDPWGMRPELLRNNAEKSVSNDQMLIVEAMMGLYDGAADGTGSAASLSVMLGLPVLLVINCARMSQSVAAIVRGYSEHDPDVTIAGVILNNVASARHEAMLRSALEANGYTVSGVLYRDEKLNLPERHLGLVQASEREDLEAFIEHAAAQIEKGCDVPSLVALSGSAPAGEASVIVARLTPPGQRVAIARDVAFAFSYEHMLRGWLDCGAEISFFSPLANEVPKEDADAIFLPGGYPELHGGVLSSADQFKDGLLSAAERNVPIYGECGGYMVLGDALIDAEGHSHAMLGLLPLTTSFAERRLHLGYRRVEPKPGFFWNFPLKAHEFHYASIIGEDDADRLFDVEDAVGTRLGAAGLRRGSVCGSFMHVIDRAGTS